MPSWLPNCLILWLQKKVTLGTFAVDFSIKRYTPSSVCILLNVYKNLSSEVHIVMSTCTLQVPVTNDAS